MNCVMLFIKKKFIQLIYKQRFRDITILKLVLEKCNQKFRKYNPLYS